MVTLKPTSIENLYELMHDYKEEFIGEHNNGVTTFLYSGILTHGVEMIFSEMDMKDSSFIGHHGHCT
jgi:hypothetical protein